MPPISYLDFYFTSHYKPDVRYLREISLDPEAWNEGQQGDRRT